MPKRLQVILQDSEYREIQLAAGAQHLSRAAWVRRALTSAQRREPTGDMGKKIAVVRAAICHNYPSADIEKMQPEIESSYGIAEQR